MENITATQMMWKPKMIRLTTACHPSVNGGKPTACFVDPQMIASLVRQEVTNKSPAGEIQNTIECTVVGCCHFALYVQEPPEVVAMLRDRALGYESGPKAA